MAELAAATVAAQAAYVLHEDRLRARGVRLPSAPLPPWLRAVMSEPDRPLAQVLRLFPEGQGPDALSGLLGAEPASKEALDALFQETLAAIAACRPQNPR